MKRLVLTLVAGSLAAAAIAKSPPPPVQPDSKWVVNFADDQCIAIRQYSTPYGTTIYRFEQPLLGNWGIVFLMFPKGPTTDRDWGMFTPSWPGRVAAANKPATYSVGSFADGRRFLTFPMTDIPQADQFDMILNFSHNDGIAIHMKQWVSVRQLLESCSSDLRKAKGFPEKEYSLVVTHAVGDIIKSLSDDDYPRDAIRNHQQGEVRIFYWIEVDGSITDCKIDKSSGFALLDQATCVAAKRTKFVPARDANGRPIREPSYSTIRWALPE